MATRTIVKQSKPSKRGIMPLPSELKQSKYNKQVADRIAKMYVVDCTVGSKTKRGEAYEKAQRLHDKEINKIEETV